MASCVDRQPRVSRANATEYTRVSPTPVADGCIVTEGFDLGGAVDGTPCRQTNNVQRGTDPTDSNGRVVVSQIVN